MHLFCLFCDVQDANGALHVAYCVERARCFIARHTQPATAPLPVAQVLPFTDRRAVAYAPLNIDLSSALQILLDVLCVNTEKYGYRLDDHECLAVDLFS